MTSWSTINATSLPGIAFSPPSTRRKGDGFREGLNPSYGLRDSGLPSDLPDGRGVENPVQSPLQKYFASPVGQIISTTSRHPTPQQGRIAIVTDAGWDAVDAAASCARRDRRAGSLNP